MSKFLITGITGFIGSNMAKFLLDKGHEVHGITFRYGENELLYLMNKNELNRIKFHNFPIQYNNLVQRFFHNNIFDGVFHFAAQGNPTYSFIDPIETFETNVMGSLNIITALQGLDTKLLYMSTSEVYGDTCKDKGILKVTDELKPNNPYAVSKAAIDLYMQERMANNAINGLIVRGFSQTGIKRGQNFSISSDAYQIAKIKLGLQEPVLKIGNLKTKRVVIDVRDAINAYYLLMMNNQSSGKIFNVCGAKEDIHEMQYFTDKLIELAGFKHDEIIQEIEPKFFKKADIDIQIGDCTELIELIGWKPEIPIEQTLQDLLDYWIKRLSNECKRC